MLRATRFALIVALLTGSTLLSAADNATAVTDIKDADGDFAYQGEYLGSALNQFNCCQTLGLQVVALGNGEFKAVEYANGLPGYGWPIGGERTKYTGKLESGTLTLTSETRKIDIASDGRGSVRTADEHGRNLGYANKVHRASSTLGACAPYGSVVLFDGTSADKFKAGAIVEGNLLKEGTETTDAYGDFRLHLEFRLPYMPLARDQGRANSGVYIQSRYEVQILDSFGLEGEFNECGSLYRQRKPDLNMCLPPLSWQTYDIWFTGPKFDRDGKKSTNGRITAWLNGVAVQDDVEIVNKTGAGQAEGPKALVTKLQNHSNPVRFRNIWLIETDGTTNSHYCPNTYAVQGKKSDRELMSLLKTIGFRK